MSLSSLTSQDLGRIRLNVHIHEDFAASADFIGGWVCRKQSRGLERYAPYIPAPYDGLLNANNPIVVRPFQGRCHFLNCDCDGLVSGGVFRPLLSDCPCLQVEREDLSAHPLDFIDPIPESYVSANISLRKALILLDC